MAFAIGLPVLGLLYAADASYFGMTAIGYSDTVVAYSDKITQQEAGVEDKKKQAQELKERTKEIDAIKAETAALTDSINLLKSKIPGEAEVPVLLYDIERIAKASEGDLDSFHPSELKPYGSSPGSAPLPSPPPPPEKPKPKPKADADAGSGGAEDGAAPASGGTTPEKSADAPPPRPATADIMEMPVVIGAHATYPQVIKFLDQLSTYERKLNVSNLHLALDAKSGDGKGAAASAAGTGATSVFKNTLKVDFTLTAYVLKKSEGQP